MKIVGAYAEKKNIEIALEILKRNETYIFTDYMKATKRAYSYSDRARYYFTRPAVMEARRQLIKNLSVKPIPLYLIAQYAPVQYEKIREGLLENTPEEIVSDRIMNVMERYYTNMLIGVQRKER